MPPASTTGTTTLISPASSALDDGEGGWKMAGMPRSNQHQQYRNGEAAPKAAAGQVAAAAAVDDLPSGAPSKKSVQFWAVIGALSLTGMLAALEGTIITSALPTITNTLGGSNAYVWIPNSYLLASVVILPFIAQLSDIFGRRWPLLTAVALFILGSGMCGGASTMGMLIAARTVQGLGGGGITLLIETVVTDTVPLRERGKYMAITLLGSILGTAGGPFLGGIIVERTTWRWIFYLNLPIASLAFGLLFVFFRVQYPAAVSWRQRLAKMDILGNAIFSGTIVSILIALAWAGSVYEWQNYRIIAPLTVGLFGVALWVTFEWTLSKQPSFPRKIVSNRTSSAVLAITLLHSLTIYWAFYFLPVYFQAVKGVSPFRSGVFTLPYFAGILPFGIIGGVLLSKWGRYKPLHLIGWAIMVLACGLFSLLDSSSSVATFVCFQLLFAVGSGLLAVILLPATQAPLEESLVALTTGIWTFTRLFGGIWGVAIPSVIFNNECRNNAKRLVSDPEIAQLLTGGRAYDHATQAFLKSIEDPTVREEVVEVFSESMRVVWYCAVAFAGLGFLVTFIEKEVKLRDELNTEYVLEEKKNA